MERGTSYLGLPSSIERSVGKSSNFIMKCIRGKLKGLKQKFLNQGGREILIKAVVQAILTYAMACFLLPKDVCSKFIALIRSFWWGGDGDSKRICWKNWATCSKAKIGGGLGFRDCHQYNLAMLARQGWRLLSKPNSYWARFLKATISRIQFF